MKTIRVAGAGLAVLSTLALAACGGDSSASNVPVTVSPAVMQALDVPVASFETNEARSAADSTPATDSAANGPTATDSAATDDMGAAADDSAGDDELLSAVSTAYKAVFDGAAMDTTYLQDASAHEPSIQEMTSSAAMGGDVSVNVLSAQEADAATCESEGASTPCAAVTFDLLYNGSPVLSAIKGYAAKSGDTWVVASSTWCDIATMAVSEPAGC